MTEAKTAYPCFTARNVPISELAEVTGRSQEFLKRGLRQGVFDFGYAVKSESGSQYSYYCPDKLVWEKLGYFNADAANPLQTSDHRVYGVRHQNFRVDFG